MLFFLWILGIFYNNNKMNSFEPITDILTRQNGNVMTGFYAPENDYLFPYDADDVDNAEGVYTGRNNNSCISATELWDTDYIPFPHLSRFYPENNQYYHDNVRMRIHLTDDIRVDESATALSKALGNTFNRMLSASLNYKYQFIIKRSVTISHNSVYDDWMHFNQFKTLSERKKRTPPDARDLPIPPRFCKKSKFE